MLKPEPRLAGADRYLARTPVQRVQDRRPGHPGDAWTILPKDADDKKDCGGNPPAPWQYQARVSCAGWETAQSLCVFESHLQAGRVCARSHQRVRGRGGRSQERSRSQQANSSHTKLNLCTSTMEKAGRGNRTADRLSPCFLILFITPFKKEVFFPLTIVTKKG